MTFYFIFIAFSDPSSRVVTVFLQVSTFTNSTLPFPIVGANHLIRIHGFELKEGTIILSLCKRIVLAKHLFCKIRFPSKTPLTLSKTLPMTCEALLFLFSYNLLLQLSQSSQQILVGMRDMIAL